MNAPLVTPLAALPPSVWLRRPRALPFPFTEPGVRVYARARHALYHGVRALGLGDGAEILVPAFHHGSEVEAFLRAGLRCRFYDGDPLRPDPDELDSLAGPATRALHLVHVLGIPQDAPAWRRWCDDRGLALVEDAAQGWLSYGAGVPVGSSGDLAVFCLYKTFGLADGAALVCRTRGAVTPDRGPLGLRGLALEHLLWLATRSRALASAADRHPPRAYVPVEEMALGDAYRGPARASVASLRRAFEPDVAAVRRRNYIRLAELLAGHVPERFAVLPPGASPFALPIAVERKAETVAALRALRVRTLELWARPHPSVADGAFPVADALRRTLVGLPVHQELRDGDVDRVAAAVDAVVTAAARARATLARTRTTPAPASSASAAPGS